MEDTIKELHAEIKRLNTELAETRSEAARYRSAKKSLAEEHNRLKGDHESLVKEHDAIKARQSDPTSVERELAELKGKLRERDHKDAFHRVARAAGVREEAIDDVWAVSRYVPASDSPDEKHLQTLVGDVVKAKPYFLASKDETAQPAAHPEIKALLPGPGLDRGNHGGFSDLFTVKESDLQNLSWMSANQQKYADAAKEGRVHYLAGQ